MFAGMDTEHLFIWETSPYFSESGKHLVMV